MITISQLKNALDSSLPKRKQEDTVNRSEFEFTMQTTKGFIEYILWQEHLDQQSKNQLLLEAIWVDINITDYCFGTIYYSKVADRYLSEEHRGIVRNCIKTCDKKYFNPTNELIYNANEEKY